MANKRLIVMVGLPRSGKTTVCEHYRAEGVPVVARDAVRLAVHGCRFRPEAEELVAAITKQMVTALFIAGHDTVVVDECNVTEKERAKWKSPHWTRLFHVVGTPPSECKRRAFNNEDWEILPVIERMAAQWEDPQWQENSAEALRFVRFDLKPLPPCGGPWRNS